MTWQLAVLSAVVGVVLFVLAVVVRAIPEFVKWVWTKGWN